MNSSERIYRLLLRAYPRDFRDEYGQEMSLLFRARSGEGRLKLWVQVLGDLLLHAPREPQRLGRPDPVLLQDVQPGGRALRLR